MPILSYFWGSYSFSPIESAGTDSVEFLMQGSNVEAPMSPVKASTCTLCKLNEFKVWEEEVGPSTGMVFNDSSAATAGRSHFWPLARQRPRPLCRSTITASKAKCTLGCVTVNRLMESSIERRTTWTATRSSNDALIIVGRRLAGACQVNG